MSPTVFFIHKPNFIKQWAEDISGISGSKVTGAQD
jgi:hypothetical protein